VSSGLYTPVVVIAAVYAGLAIAAGVVAGRGDGERSERYRDLAFGTVLLAAAYTVVLLVLAATDAPNRFTDMIKIFLVVIAFFALLLFLLFLISQVYARLRRSPGS
jgi:cytochrome bd-type quinol oxidase subunit 2